MTFEAFYQSHRGRPPFPWMSRLANEFSSGKMPTIIDIPTGCGKSEIVFIWAWARQSDPTVPRRLWMVSDRRVIVDQTYEAASLLAAPGGLLVSRLRGGIVQDDSALLDPVRSQIITSTVDQLGSRLLFRGYGASPRSWPIWAALAGTDSLIVLDEAHLSPNAEDTFRACQERLGAGIKVISMTATPRQPDVTPFRLDDADRNHPVLSRRLNARKWVELRDVGSLAQAAQELLAEGSTRVAIICNTVRTARAEFESLRHPDKHLLIGRQRPLDRDAILEGLLPRLRSGAPPTTPLVVVATQCIEAGADFDFDGMVSEACPIDALRQRVGRLNRLGSAAESRLILIKPAEAKDVPPYGESPGVTWRFLSKHAKTQAKRKIVDLGDQGWNLLRDQVPEEARSARPAPVTFLEPHLRMLSRTSPRPFIEPDIDLLLHGRERAVAAVSLVWRREAVIENGDAEAASEILSLVRPAALEACEVPLWEVRAWLAGTPAIWDSGDIEGAVSPRLKRNDETASIFVLRWDGAEDGATLVAVPRLKPGDVVILPSARGGYDEFGWNPRSTANVPDLADEAYRSRTGRTITRIDQPDAEFSGGIHHRWSGGVVVEMPSTEVKEGAGRDREIPLDAHQNRVAKQAKDFADQLGLDGALTYHAGLHHDDGKADWRWQLCVNGGRLDRLVQPPLAKGRYVVSSLAKLPKRWRHEAESVARLPEDAPPIVRWLIATHHGYARPFWPSQEHGIGHAELMDNLQVQYGVWGLALYEAVLRCADRAVSRAEGEADAAT